MELSLRLFVGAGNISPTVYSTVRIPCTHAPRLSGGGMPRTAGIHYVTQVCDSGIVGPGACWYCRGAILFPPNIIIQA